MQLLGKEAVPIKGWTEKVPIEASALEQVKNVARLPFIHKHVAVMPDCHWGMGATVGSVIPTKGAIIPAAVGVDIGCGMMAVQTNISAQQLPDNLSGLRTLLEKKIPHGRTAVGRKYNPSADRGLWHDTPEANQKVFYGIMGTELRRVLEDADDAPLERQAERAVNQLGTLGTGNHFVEVCIDEYDWVWVMLHSGSRGIGNRIGSLYIEKAKEEMRRWHINLPDANLAYFPEGTEYFDKYVRAVGWAQMFARTNRELMMAQAFAALNEFFPFGVVGTKEAINCHHNYVEQENHFGANVWLTRKGAVRAREGDLGIIPGSMGERSFIVSGKGNAESFHSCSHGAGRVMSRTEARKTITLEQHIKDTEGVECKKDASVIDESPKAYKNIDDVMFSQRDLINIEHTLKQVVCVKG